jgi:Xaa-Pro aminopeptidase
MPRYETRVERFRRRLDGSGYDAAIVARGPTARYLTGFGGEGDRHLLYLVEAGGSLTAVTPEAYTGQVRANARVDDVRTVPANTAEAVVEGVGAELPTTGGRYVLDDGMPAGEAHRLERAHTDATFALLEETLGPVRARKDADERAALARAASLTDEVSVAIRELGADAVGTTERDLAVDIRTKLHERGAEGVAFPVVVAAGPNGAQPTAYRHGSREIRSGEPVVLDFGGVFDGYASDQTRTVVFDGEPSEQFREAHDVVRQAVAAGVEAAEAGTTGAELDAAVRDVVAAAGYGDAFTTGTGHGVGLRGHEHPTIAPDSADELAPGMVFSIEPGIYVPGAFGVRIETLVALDADGATPLNTSPDTWRPL